MSKRGDIEFLQDIEEAGRRILEYLDKIQYKQFTEDIKTQDAVIRNFEIIGEVVKNISKELRERYPQVVWGDLAKVRDKLIHHYFGVNVDIIWDISEEELPQLILEIREILKDFDK
ncbi:MAG: DUF86 domain-containing protein [Candidatus Omnitrophica bacterium]|nr:DUF86 domain-containing protein [Candidatus Omnitrophota bacterium]MCB9748193.1 DUF86 domain-containing protein [Candidatus Omnitrophota bacterium]